jgi:hypothetical protein
VENKLTQYKQKWSNPVNSMKVFGSQNNTLTIALSEKEDLDDH